MLKTAQPSGSYLQGGSSPAMIAWLPSGYLVYSSLIFADPAFLWSRGHLLRSIGTVCQLYLVWYGPHRGTLI